MYYFYNGYLVAKSNISVQKESVYKGIALPVGKTVDNKNGCKDLYSFD